MAASVEAKGKSVDEAIFNGLNELGLGIDEVDIEIIEEGGKRLFGRKPAIVRMTERTAPVVPEVDLSPAPEKKHDRRQEHRKQRPSGEDRERQSRGQGQNRRDRKRPDRDRRPKKEASSERAERPERTNRPQSAAVAAEPRPAPAPAQSEPEAAAPVVQPKILEVTDIRQANEAMDFLNGMFEIMKFNASVGALDTTDSDNIRLKITGEDTPALIGRRGDTLDALQYLTGLVVNKGSDEYIRVMLDAEDYREKREQTLQKLAKRLATNVVKSGKPARLEPMNPYERRILHSALQNNPQVETFSEGVDPNRRVVIRKKRGTGRERRPRYDI